jgi:cytochrome c oxidase subunit 3
MFFAGLFSIYFTLRAMSPELWEGETAKLNVLFSLINTLILVSSSFSCQWGVFKAEQLKPRRSGKLFEFWRWGMVEWFFVTYALGAVFVILQIFEYTTLIAEGVALDSNSYGSAFYITTGFHGLHVTGGLIAFLLVIGRAYSVKNFGHKEATSAIVVSYYWHFVDVVWIALFLVIYVLK